MSDIPTTTVRYSPNPYTGWRRWMRKLLRRPVNGVTYEFEAIIPGTYYHSATNSDITSFTIQPTGPIRKIQD